MSTLTVSSAPAEDTGPHTLAELMRRVVSLWDVAGVTLFVFVMLCVTEVAVDNVDGGLDRLPFLRGLTVGAGLVAVVAIGVAALVDPPRPLAVPARLLDVWRDPPGEWPAFVLGTALALPLLGLFTPVVLADADSVRIVAAVRYVQIHGPGFLVDTQDNFGPHLILGPALSLAGLEGIRVVTIITVQALAGVTALVTRRLSGSMAAAAVAAVALLSIPAVMSRATYIPMYPAMLAFGYGGGYLAWRALTDGALGPLGRLKAWRYPLPAALCLVLALECQSVGQLFMAVPVLLLITVPFRDLRAALGGLARTYVAVAVLMVPRLVVNLSEGGTSRLTSNRTDYWINKGYVRRIQSEFWNYEGINEPLRTYVERLPSRFVESLGGLGWVTLAVAGVGILALRGRMRLFALSCVGFMALAATAKRVPPFARYYSPLWPGIAILVGLLVAALIRRRHVVLRSLGTVAALAVTGVIVAVAVNTYEYRGMATNHVSEPIEDGTYHYQQLLALIDDGKGVIGARSHVLLNVTADIDTYGGQFLTEDEYATFLTWPSDEAVIAMMERHDIGWVLVNPNRMLEIDYHNTWLVPNHGHPARHVWMVDASPNFCKVASPGGLTLYRLDTSQGPCPLEEGVDEDEDSPVDPTPPPLIDDPSSADPALPDAPLADGPTGTTTGDSGATRPDEVGGDESSAPDPSATGVETLKPLKTTTTTPVP
ncbi:MAG TPA: hypothetical protein VF743_09065 [Acidimicrobiales bacterium]